MIIGGGCSDFVEKNKLLINIDDTDSNNNKLIFVNKNRDTIKSIYRIFSIRNLCSIYINYLYSGDIFCDKFIAYIGIFITLCIMIYSLICYKARQNNKYLFIQDYILTNLFFIFFILYYFIIYHPNKNINISMKKTIQVLFMFYLIHFNFSQNYYQIY